MKKKIPYSLQVIATLVLCAVLLAVRLTGEPLHMILALAAIIVMVIHAISKGRRLKYVPISWCIVDLLLICSIVVLLITGMLLHPMKGVMLVLILHKLSSVFMVITCIVHMVQHRPKPAQIP